MAQNVLDTDSFAGVNTNVLHTYNANWVPLDVTNMSEAVIQGTPGVGGPSGSNAVNGDLRNGQTWTVDQWAELKIDATNLADARFLVCVRATQGSGNNCTGYAAGVHRDITGGAYQMYKFTTPGTFVQVGTDGAHSYALGDVVNLQVVGTTLTLTVNGVTEITATDPTFGTGSPALIVGSQALRLAGTWRAGSVGSVGPVVPNFIIEGARPFPYSPSGARRR